jgi:hypothetical protein
MYPVQCTALYIYSVMHRLHQKKTQKEDEVVTKANRLEVF